MHVSAGSSMHDFNLMSRCADEQKEHIGSTSGSTDIEDQGTETHNHQALVLAVHEFL